MTGRFIAFEGGEGTGKSTQVRMLADALAAKSIAVVSTREPGGTIGAEAIRELLLSPPGDGWSMRSEALLFAAARADHVGNLIRPAIARGQWVLCDRFVDSSRAYQGAAGDLGYDSIDALHEFGSDGLEPDLTIVLTVDDAARRQRLLERDGGASDAIGGRDTAFHRKVADAFVELTNRPSYVQIDGGRPVEDVHRDVVAAIEERFGLS